LPEHGLDFWLAIACLTFPAAVIGVALAARAGVIEGGIAYLLGNAPRAHELITEAIPHLGVEHSHTLSQAHFLAALIDYQVDPAGAFDRLLSRLAHAVSSTSRKTSASWAPDSA